MNQSLSGPEQAQPLVFEQRATTGSFLGLSVVNGLLNLITLTLYRFWGRTEVRRRLWATTFVNGEPFEYTGKGGELFKGFLIATAIIVLPYLVIVFVAQLLPPMIGLPLLLAVILALYAGIGAAVWLSFRYLASRTTWRGIRFELAGSAKDYSLMYFGQLLLTVITLGWWSPKAAIKVSAPLWGRLSFGSLPLEFDEGEARKEHLYGPFAIGWVALIVGYAVFGFAMTGIIRDGLDPNDPEAMLAILGPLYLGLFVLALFAGLAFTPYQAAVARAIVRGIRFQGATFRLDMKWLPLAVLSFTNIVLLTFSLGLLSPLVQARSFRFTLSRLSGEGAVDFDAAMQAARGPDQAEGLADALDLGMV